MKKLGILGLFIGIAVLLLVLGFLYGQSYSSDSWQVRMLQCGGTYQTGVNTYALSDVDGAKAHADSMLERNDFDIAYVSQDRGVYGVLWVKTDSDDCYNGQFRDWTYFEVAH